MKDVAAGLASLGRGPDTMLVHMSPGEVAGLQSLAKAHGGSLTVNPHTGLPEAGYLSNILPTIIGIGATILSGGTITPLMAGLGVGGIEALRTGDIGKGLMAGLGAFGGAGMGEALAGIGANATAAQGLAAQNTADLTAGALPQEIFVGQGAAAPMINTPILGSQGLGNVAAGVKTLGGQFAASPTQALSTAGSALTDAYGGRLGQTAAGIGALGALGGMGQPPLATPPEQPRSQARMSGPIRRPYDPSAPGGYYFTDYGTLRPTYADGGIVAFNRGGAPELSDGGFVLPADVVSHLGNGDTDSGLAYAARRLGAVPIKGNGDGMSDSIPTSIDGRYRARVAAGEAYIPPEKVKRVGGAKKLYAMMDKVRQARTGSTKQGRQINPERFAPA